MSVSQQDRAAAEHLNMGEYGATKVVVSRDGSLVRLAFGRSGLSGPVFTGAVLLAPEAIESSKAQLAEL